MRILSRYLAARFLAFFASTLAASILSIVIVEMLLNFDNIVQRGEGLGALLDYFFVRIPSYYFRDLVPVACFVASFLCLGLAARWLEITAMKAGGISPHRAGLPVLLSAACVAVVAFALNETWVVEATQGKARPYSDGADRLSFQQGSFWFHRGRTIYRVTQAERSSRSLEGVNLFERDRLGRLVRSVHAESARVEDERHWRITNATIRRFDPDRPEGRPSIERFAETLLVIADDSEGALLDADAATLPLTKLRQYIEARLADGSSAIRSIVLFHTRLSDPLTAILLAVLAAPFGFLVERTRSLGLPALLAVGVLAAFFAARSVGTGLAAEGLISPVAGPWSATVVFGGLGLWRLSRIPS